MRRCQLYSLFIVLLLVVSACRPSPDVLIDDDQVPAIRLSDATEASGLTSFENVTGARGQFWFPETMGGGVAMFDLDNDGDLDLAAATGGRWDGVSHNAVRVYRNVGDARFEEVTAASGISGTNDYSMGFAVGDVNGDGWEDLFVTNVAGNRLYINREGSLEDATTTSGLDDTSVWSTSAAFLDGDNDGDLDLLVGNYVNWSPENDLWCSNDGTDKTYCTPALYEGVSPSYYVNRGDGRFDNRSEASGFATSNGKTLGVVTLDFNRDGWTDVALANDTRADELFINNGDGTFEDIGLTAGFAYDERGKARAGMGLDATVYWQAASPSDRLEAAQPFQWSLAVGNFADEMIGVYRDVGNATLVDRSAALQVGHASLRTLTFGVLFSDVNLDGRDDLLAINGHIQPEIGRIRDNVTFRQPPHVFTWEGGQFRDVVRELDVAIPLVGRGLASGDLDGDGDLDYVVSENGAGLRLWQNGATSAADASADGGAAFVSLDLSRGGAPSSAIGTRVVVFEKDLSVEQTVRGGRSYLSASAYEVVVGLGSTAAVDGGIDSVRVFWPGGRSDLLTDVAVNTRRVVGAR